MGCAGSKGGQLQISPDGTGTKWSPFWDRFMAAEKADPKLGRVHEAELKILKQMDHTEFEVQNIMVPLSMNARCQACMDQGKWCKGHPEHHKYPIHTVIVGADHNDELPIVLIHGFMMGAACFYKWYPLLAEKRKVYAIDVIGMGGSGQPAFAPSTITKEKAENLLVEPFILWAEAMGLKKFILLGHSFGGFVASAWASRDQGAHIAHLGLLSPLLGWTDQRIEGLKGYFGGSWQRKAVLSIVESAWANHFTPQTLVRWIPGAEKYFKKNAERRFGRGKTLTEEEGKLLAEYVIATMLTPASAEAAATVLFEPFCRPVEVDGATIKQRLTTLQVPLFAIYGDHDWMDAATDQEVPNCTFITQTDSGHHLYFDNPPELTEHVLNELSKHKS
eukprot:TRINITY_DN34178_c0_g1_i1.p1 TRINITY_DN34178_c0_g1~~TRINITY_DN34178_c0_g1_i1.p1  ORF type:complete len:401 (-),score=82.16 TRINITY_DN34178_c0_g1_i1:41-1210(-)